MSLLKDKKFTGFLIKFLLFFCIFYYGTKAVIGLAAPGGMHVAFIEKYADYVSWLKQSMLWSVGIMSGWAGYGTTVLPGFIIKINNGAGVLIAMSCVGYGVYSFWAAYVIANSGSWQKKLSWALGGLFFLWLINSIRITLVLIALQLRKPMPFGVDHHTWFNIVAYIAIFGMIWMFERKQSPINNE